VARISAFIDALRIPTILEVLSANRKLSRDRIPLESLPVCPLSVRWLRLGVQVRVKCYEACDLAKTFKVETSQPRRAHLTRVSNLRVNSNDVLRRLIQALR
jgi:hypothetical protein